MRVLFLYESLWASAWYRSFWVASELNRIGHTAIMTNEPTQYQLDTCDIVCARMWVNDNMNAAIDYARNQGKKYVLDIDDNVWTLHADNPAFAHYANPENASRAKDVMIKADLVTSATDYLTKKVGYLNDNIITIENNIPASLWLHEPVNLDKDELTLGWAGSSSHAPDVRELKSVIDTILNQYKNVKFAYTDSVPPTFTANSRIIKIPPTTVHNYHTIIPQFDIGLAPTIDNEFNRAKSDLKIVEYGIHGIPTIASKVVPYEASIEHGIDGFLVKNGKDWLKFIKRIIEDKELRIAMGAAARAKYENRTVEKQIHKWEQAFQSLLT